MADVHDAVDLGRLACGTGDAVLSTRTRSSRPIISSRRVAVIASCSSRNSDRRSFMSARSTGRSSVTAYVPSSGE